jgi:phage-related protein
MKNSAVLLHAIRKKTDEIPDSDLELCLKRKQSVEDRGKIEQL